jgi:transposase-like protein
MSKAKGQATQNRWTRDPQKESYWKVQMDLWQKSGLSVRAFCKEHGIVETSFYAWRRELIIRARELGKVEGDVDALSTTPNAVRDSRGRTIRVCFRQTDRGAPLSVPHGQSLTENPFVPLSVVGDNPQAAVPRLSSVSSAGITITTPSGYGLRVTSVDDCLLFEQVLLILEDKAKC